VVSLNRPIPRHHDFFHQQLDHRLAVFETQAVHRPPEQSTEGRDMACDMFPLHGRVTLRFDLWSCLLEALEPLRDLRTPGSQLLQGEPLLLIGVDEPRELPLSIVSLEAHPISGGLALALLPLLDLLPQRVFLQHRLGFLQQGTYQGPPQRIETGGSPKPGWAALGTARRHGVLPGTLLIQGGGALPHPPLPCGRPMSRPRPTAPARPQPIARRGRLRRTPRFCLRPWERLWGFSQRLGHS
jgi:hypothetical protein